jgi:hypothetical protein
MTTETKGKLQQIQERAQTAYDAEDINWFRDQPLSHLAVLWGACCAEGAAYDDEVYDALDERHWFEDDAGTMRFRVKFFTGDRCTMVEHNASAEHVAHLLRLWGEIVTEADERIEIEQGNER